MGATTRRFAGRFPPLMLPVFGYGLTAMGKEVTRSLFGSGDVIAFGKRVFFFLAARIFVREVLRDTFLRILGRYVLIPVAALYALGILDDITLRLEETTVALGNIQFSVMALIRGLIAGSLLFWLGRGRTGKAPTTPRSKRNCAPPPANWRSRRPKWRSSARRSCF